MKLAFYENLVDNIQKHFWDAVWDDSFLAKQGHKIRRHLEHDGESCGPKSAYNEEALRVLGLKLVGDYIVNDFN